MLPDKSLYATCASGLQDLLAAELQNMGASAVSTAGAGVRFEGSLEVAYRSVLWSRVANRVLLPIHAGAADSPETLYTLIQQVDWSEHMALHGTLAVDFFTANSNITHSQYGALKVKDAIVDQFREKTGERPNVERETPDLRVNVYLFRNKARIAIDLSGSSLHRRGYREQAGPAPVKENLAASLLLACDWPARAARGEPLIDPLCGSGTLAIEAAMMACNIAPGLKRRHFGFTGWLGHDETIWTRVYNDAQQSVQESPCLIRGADKDASAIRLAKDNAQLAGVEHCIEFTCENVLTQSLTIPMQAGLVLSNPPYGERLETDSSFYQQLGSALSAGYGGWHCALFTAIDAPVKHLRLPIKPTLPARNGSIECALFQGIIPGLVARSTTEPDTTSLWKNAVDNRAAAPAAEEHNTSRVSDTHADAAPSLAVDIEPFSNRLKKNLKKLKSWVTREHINAWRAYDADLPEFSVAIDVYDCETSKGVNRHVVVQEYQAPATVNSAMATARLKAVLATVPDALSVSADQVYLKVREKQSGLAQYEKQSASNVTGVVREHGYLVECNFTDYLDTGLFLDHRKVRQYIRAQAQGKRFLNLFSYTGSATIAAASGGASHSVSVDLSNRYSQWLTRNLRHNRLDESKHEVVRGDVGQWLDNYNGEPFDLILLDPPTFSNSTGIDADWNIQRDHVACIKKCMDMLSAGGTLIFSNNYRRFKLDTSLGDVQIEKKGAKPNAHESKVVADASHYTIIEKTRWSIDQDFQRNARIHQCWFFSHP